MDSEDRKELENVARTYTGNTESVSGQNVIIPENKKEVIEEKDDDVIEFEPFKEEKKEVEEVLTPDETEFFERLIEKHNKGCLANKMLIYEITKFVFKFGNQNWTIDKAKNVITGIYNEFEMAEGFKPGESLEERV